MAVRCVQPIVNAGQKMRVLLSGVVVIGLALPVPAQSANTLPGRLLKQWTIADERCRGGPRGDPATGKACEDRQRVSGQLEKRAWIFGYPGWYGACQAWHPAKQPRPHKPECQQD